MESKVRLWTDVSVKFVRLSLHVGPDAQSRCLPMIRVAFLNGQEQGGPP